ncbi:hypothetical protein BURK1_03307 [Burkholderiales bacterium]|nr:hypothetical protein BURK1_03307 [Burkholderiales bacterium]
MNARGALLGLALAAGVAGAANGQVVVHGSSDAYAARGVAMAWGVTRGADEASTAVVVRVVTDAGTYPWVAVRGVDPFTRADQTLDRARRVGIATDVRIPRAQFADTPRTEWLYFASEEAARAGTPALVVYYLGVPDTTPEFADAAKLDAYLGSRIARARAESGDRTP